MVALTYLSKEDMMYIFVYGLKISFKDDINLHKGVNTDLTQNDIVIIL